MYGQYYSGLASVDFEIDLLELIPIVDEISIDDLSLEAAVE